MNNSTELIQALRRLCIGDYSEQDVLDIVDYFFRETRRFLLHKETYSLRFRGEWEYGTDEIDDLALDFIAPLFARDAEGAFIELRVYYGDVGELSPRKFEEKTARLLNSIIHQEAIRIFSERDPFGRIFHRSLRYVVQKHPEWTREGINGTQIIRNSREELPICPDDLLEEVFRETASRESSLTPQIEETIRRLIEEKQMAVPVSALRTLATWRNRVLADQEVETEVPGDETFIRDSIQREIESTKKEVDASLLKKYETAEKLTSGERQAFRRAIEQILIDFAEDDINENYYSYLSAHLDSLEQMEEYRQRYRGQFEYAVRVAKETFSAKMRNVVSI